MNNIPVFNSTGSFKTAWNVIVLASVLLFSLFFSYRYTFHIYETDVLYWLLMFVFSLDVLVNFNSTVKIAHETITNRKAIARHYLKSWFAVDFIAAVPIDILAIALCNLSAINPKEIIFLIILQCITLLKLLKVKKIIIEFRNYLRINPAFMRLLTFAFWFSQAVHYIALGWIIIGAAEVGRSPLDQYIRALYWAITTVATIGYGDYTPDLNSNVQIIFTIVVQIFGVGMYGYIIGNVSGLIANLDTARTQFLKKIEEVTAYLKAKGIPEDLQEKILNYYYYLWDKKKSITEQNPLYDLPASLKIDVMLHLNKEMICNVVLFKHTDEVFIREAIQMLTPLIYMPNDYIIRQGEYGDCMYFLSSGEVDVIVDGRSVATLSAGSAFGETALLKGEKRNASIVTKTYCDVFRLAKSDFDILRKRFPKFDKEIKRMAHHRKRRA
ncbi:MAG: cyclic nucleotide-binding domain-containing protein [Spirochaetes bacterium]|nr:cyclic nucleotide-binding domain-containing protein [Spirochaetota bacterium]